MNTMVAAAVALVALITTPLGAAAQEGRGLPTLADLGVGYQSSSGGFQLDLSGRLDIEGFIPQRQPQGLVAVSDPLIAGRLRLFADIFAGDRLYGMIEFRADRGEAPADVPVEARIEQAYLRIAMPLPGRLQLQAGKFALPVGSYPERHLTVADPLIRPPIMYDHRTIVNPAIAPGATAGFLNWKDEPGRRSSGVPIVWSVPYPWGTMVAGGAGNLDFRIALLSAAPSGAPGTWELDAGRLEHPTQAAALSYAMSPELRLAAFFSRGPFLEELSQGSLPEGSDPRDFKQQIWGADVAFARGRTVLRAEAFSNRWDVPNLVAPARDFSYSLEGSVKLAAGLFVAARFGEIRFNELSAEGGPPGTPARLDEPWDHDTRRFQIGAGYRLLRNTELRAEYLISRTTQANPSDNLLSIQWWWAF